MLPVYICIGKIFEIPETPEYPRVRQYVISHEPAESMGEIGKIVLSKLWIGEKQEDWQVQWGSRIIDFSVRPWRIRPQDLIFAIADTLPSEKIEELKRARYEAEKRGEYFDPYDPRLK